MKAIHPTRGQTNFFLFSIAVAFFAAALFVARAAETPRLLLDRDSELPGAQSYLLLERTGDTNWNHTIEVSTNLTDWKSITECGCLELISSAGGNGTNQIVTYRVSLTNGHAHFFRAKMRYGSPLAYELFGVKLSPYVAPDEDPNRNVTGQVTLEELTNRLKAIAPYTRWVRSFGSTGDLEPIGRIAHQLGMSSAVGAWLSRDEAENRRQIEALVAQALQGHVDLAVVGSEVLLRGDLPESRLLEYVREVKSRLAANQISIPVTCADVYGSYLLHPQSLADPRAPDATHLQAWRGNEIDLP